MDASEMAIVRMVKSAVVLSVSKAKSKVKWPRHKYSLQHSQNLTCDLCVKIFTMSNPSKAVYAVPFGSELSEPVAFNGTKWVLLAAGGNTWSNYRHQSNVYHAYQIIKSHGIPDTNIVVMHYDDLANNKANPTPGIVINVPNGPDVYKGVPKDYTGADVNPLNFLAVLRGDPILARNHKKVIKSGPNDHIYVYFIDHGAPDLIAFPSQYLYGEELNAQFKQMYQDKKYAKLVINIEACNSGM
ncbi:unnamed protein product [Oppiella nova]|uniref:Legumain n=1 Tax=Oppiella nova TaxID=334625 RepID=A0A7R9M5L4_9ACAR|nr:unnamed protein product [Oppiella nova]CAG2170672.1 unnamed protein product [Oppiella nova]